MKQKNCILFSLMLIAGGGRPASAALSGGLPAVEISAADSGIALGDSMTVRCTVAIPAGTAAGDPRPLEENPYIDLARRTVAEEKNLSGIVRRYHYLAYVFSPDSARVGPFAVHYVTADGDSGQVQSNVLEFPVKGFIETPDSPPKPSRDPLEIKGGGNPAWIWGALAALLAALASFLILRRRKIPEPAVAIERPLDEIAEFENIRALHLTETGQIKELYAQVSGALRGFVHRNMGFEALYSTTGEIRRKLARNWKDSETGDAIRAIFEESDMVKFAKYIPPEGTSSTVIDRAIIPVKKALELIAEERERERAAEEEGRKNSSPPSPAGTSAGIGENREERV